MYLSSSIVTSILAVSAVATSVIIEALSIIRVVPEIEAQDAESGQMCARGA